MDWRPTAALATETAAYFLDAGYNLLAFDLRGHGLSRGGDTTLG